MENIIAMKAAVKNQSVNVEYTETGARVSPYRLIGMTWKEEENMTARDAIEQIGADFNVSKRPLIQVPQSFYDAIKNGQPIDKLELSPANLITSHCATIRDDYSQVLGVVGSDYSVSQNKESLAFVDMLEEVSGRKMKITSGGVLGHGERFFLQGLLDDSVYLDGNKDEIKPYVTFCTGHTGGLSLQIMMTPLRIWCQNTLLVALREAQNKIVYKHTKNLDKRIDWQIDGNRKRALEVFSKSVQFTKAFKDAMLCLKAKDGLTEKDTLDFAAHMYLDDTKFKLYMQNGRKWDGVDEISTRSKNILNGLVETIHNGVGQKGCYEGTALHLLNGLTCFQQNVLNHRSNEFWFDSLSEGGTENKRLNKAYNYLLAA